MIDSARREARIRTILAQAFPDADITLVDESHLHRGHAGARDGKGHFRLGITSSVFEGQLPLARHRRVYEALDELMATDIHALSIDAKTPHERSR
jgi:BolA protein